MYQTPIYFAGCDLSKNGHIRLAAYLREMQKAACLDLNNFNLTPESLYARGIAFILSKTSLLIDRDHLPSAELELLTYPRASLGASFMRDFVFSQNGTVVARATTRWGILNLTTRRLVRPNELPTPIVGETDRWVGFEPPRLSPVIPEAAKSLGEAKVERCMTDANGHFNNAAYLDLCLNLTEDVAWREMHIEYRKELLEGDCVRLLTCDGENGQTLLFGQNCENDALSFVLSLRA